MGNTELATENTEVNPRCYRPYSLASTEFDDSELAHGHTELNPRPYRCGGASELDFRGEKKWDLRARNPELC